MYQHFYEVGDIVLCDQLLSLHKRDQNDPELLAKRALHRITYRLSNIDVNNPWIEKYNKGCSIVNTDAPIHLFPYFSCIFSHSRV